MDGGDGSYDPCECICSYDGAMRRLISLLRSSQSYCTDNECLDPPGAQATDSNGGFNMMFFMVAWLVAAVVLFMLRPQSTRQGGNEKPPSNQGQGPQPPAPPIQ